MPKGYGLRPAKMNILNTKTLATSALNVGSEAFVQGITQANDFCAINKTGFTLAEVLITLGIIGVVAAMTIPTLIANTNSSKFASQFKKTLSQLNQAALMSTAQWDIDYGNIDGKTAAGAVSCTDKDYLSAGTNSICGLFNSTLSGAMYLNETDLKALSSNGISYSITGKTLLGDADKLKDKIGYQLADGSRVIFPENMKDCSIGDLIQTSDMEANGALHGCIGFIDVNGAVRPNKEVTCKNADDTKLTHDEICEVPKNVAHMTDIFPIVFHNQTVEPATNAAKAILTGATKN